MRVKALEKRAVNDHEREGWIQREEARRGMRELAEQRQKIRELKMEGLPKIFQGASLSGEGVLESEPVRQARVFLERGLEAGS